MDLAPPSLALLAAALAVGLALGWLAASSRHGSRTAAAAAERDALRERVVRAEAAGDDAQEAALLAGPLREALRRVEGELRQLERARTSAYAALTEQVAGMARTSEQLRAETGALVTALRAPQVRGRWGEVQLRRVVEVAGMLERCDFDEQPSVRTEDGAVRPDLVVRLAGGKSVVIDAKVPLSAFLEAAEARDDDVRADRLQAHARQLRAHVDRLAAKRYWEAFSPAPEFVVLFVPGESLLAPALEHDPALLEDAMRQQVVVATPTTLLAMLRTIAYAWQQEALTEHAREVFDLGRDLHARLGTLGGHVDKLGRTLRRVVDDYNATVGSLERSVLAPARRLADLGVTDRELPRPASVDAVPRPLTAAELLTGAGRSDDGGGRTGARHDIEGDGEGDGQGEGQGTDARRASRLRVLGE